MERFVKRNAELDFFAFLSIPKQEITNSFTVNSFFHLLPKQPYDFDKYLGSVDCRDLVRDSTYKAILKAYAKIDREFNGTDPLILELIEFLKTARQAVLNLKASKKSSKTKQQKTTHIDTIDMDDYLNNMMKEAIEAVVERGLSHDKDQDYLDNLGDILYDNGPKTQVGGTKRFRTVKKTVQKVIRVQVRKKHVLTEEEKHMIERLAARKLEHQKKSEEQKMKELEEPTKAKELEQTKIEDRTKEETQKKPTQNRPKTKKARRSASVQKSPKIAAQNQKKAETVTVNQSQAKVTKRRSQSVQKKAAKGRTDSKEADAESKLPRETKQKAVVTPIPTSDKDKLTSKEKPKRKPVKSKLKMDTEAKE